MENNTVKNLYDLCRRKIVDSLSSAVGRRLIVIFLRCNINLKKYCQDF